MSKLQNNFTTPEQSKRLLELGVPENSADCYNTTKHIGKIPEGKTYKNIWQMSVWRKKNDSHIEMYPCWSVGRLMEIYHICIPNTSIYGWNYHEDVNGNYIDYIIQEYVDAYGELDFSKLEE